MDQKPEEKILDKYIKGRLRENLLVVAFGVTLFVILMNFDKSMSAVGTVIGLFMPLIVGGIIAFILNVPMHFFEKQVDRLTSKGKMNFLKKGKTPICLITTILVFVIILMFIGNVVFPNTIESIRNIALIIKVTYPTWITFFEEMGIDMSYVEQRLAQIDFVNIMENLKTFSTQIITTAGKAAGNVFSAVANLGLGCIFAIYILNSKKKLGLQFKKIAYAYLKKSWADELCDVARLSYKTFAVFLSGQCLEATILGGMFFVSMLIFGFPYAGTISIIIGALSLIPYIGAFLGMAFGLLLISAISLKQAIWFIVLFLVIQQIEGNIVYPRVVGGSVGLPAVWTLLAVILGGKVAGVFGIIAFIPLFSVVYALTRRSVYYRLRKKGLEKEEFVQ